MITAFFLELSPAFRCNLFIFKEKIKRIFTAIRAKITLFLIIKLLLKMENKNYPQYFEEQIFDVFKKENLKSLADDENYFPRQDFLISLYRERYFSNFQNEILFDNLEVNKELFDEKKAEIQNEKIWKISFDIKNCNDDLKLFIANLYLFHPHINDPIKGKHRIGGRVLHSYNQNFSDWNYSSLVSCCFEKLYNFWDRIGDIIALYLNLDIGERMVAFETVIVNLDKKEIYLNDENFVFLQSFREIEFREFNKMRKEVVHYNQFETTYRYDFIFKHINDEEKIKEIWKRKKNMPKYFKNHLRLSLIGYEHCIKFIEENFNKNL
jgi:hypothetical protein